MRVGTYPTRDFATLGNLLLPNSPSNRGTFTRITLKQGIRGVDHFCRPLHVAMQIGPYLVTSSVWRFRRMVSEDSREVSRLGYKLAGGLSSPAHLHLKYSANR